MADTKARLIYLAALNVVQISCWTFPTLRGPFQKPIQRCIPESRTKKFEMVLLNLSLVEMTVIVLLIVTLFRLRIRVRMVSLKFLGDVSEHRENSCQLLCYIL